MFASFARFELYYQLRSPMFIAGALLFFAIAFSLTSVPAFTSGLAAATTVNSPFMVATLIQTLAVLMLFIPTAFLSSIVLRDRELLTDDMFFTRPVTKAAYLGGRFTGAFAVSILVLLAVPLGLLAGVQMPWLDPETVAPFRPIVYLHAFVMFALPNLFIPGAVMFTVASLTRSQLAIYTALVAMIACSTAAGVLGGVSDQRTLAALVDPFGVVAYEDITRYWTTTELQTQLVRLEGSLLWNRLLWSGIAATLLCWNFWRFSFRAARLNSPPLSTDTAANYTPAARQLPTLTPVFDSASEFRQCLVALRHELLTLWKQPSSWILLGLAICAVIPEFFTIGAVYGTPVYPVTRVMMRAAANNDLIPLIIMLYLPAEIIWRDRKLRMHEIIDTLPVPSWVFVLSRLVVLWVMLFAMALATILAAIIFQFANGAPDIQPLLYLQRAVFLDLPTFLGLATLSLLVQVLVNNRYVGMLAMAVFIVVFVMLLPSLGFQHNLYRFTSTPPVFYSDMNGFGHYLRASLWFNFYWGLFMVMLTILAVALWKRGTLIPVSQRIAQLPARLSRPARSLLVATFAAFAATGAFIFYNTNIVNTYRDSTTSEELAVQHEERYRFVESLPQPHITGVNVDLDIYPGQRRYEARGSYVLENRTDAPITQIHVGYGLDVRVAAQTIDGAAPDDVDAGFMHYSWNLPTPMQPGEARTLSFSVARDNPGFKAGNNTSSVSWNGSFINNGEALPWIGFNRSMKLQDRQLRRKYGLEPLPRMPLLEDEVAARINFLRPDSDWVAFETTVSTSLDQIAVAPGTLTREWQENGRRYFQYVAQTPIQNFFTYLSARYTKAEEESNGILLQVFHHESHAYNVPRMFDAMRDGIAYFSAAFSPFQYDQMRIFEFPAFHGGFAQSFPNSVPYSEDLGFIADNTDPERIDYVYYVTAHEVAHQWWAHQVMGGDVQGSTLLLETFAQYSALMLMEREYGEHQLRRFLKMELDTYLSGRSTDVEGELPLFRMENQQYIHYRKGAVVMYALKDYLGEATVNIALARLIDEYAYQHDPYPRSSDFLRILKEEAEPQYTVLIEDMFEKIVLFDLSTTNIESKRRADGRFDVKVTIQATKFEADGEGKQTEVPLEYMMDIGLFTTHPDKVNSGDSHVLVLEKQRVQTGENVYEFIVDTAPVAAGVDPYNKLVDRNSNDNIRYADVLVE